MTGAGFWERLFLQLLNMGLGGGAVILLVVLCRLALLRAPKRYAYALWALPLIRLLVPFTLQSAHSPLPLTAQPIPQDIALMQSPRVHTGVDALNGAVNGLLPSGAPQASVNPLQVLVAVGAAVYFCGVLAMLLHGLAAQLRLQRRLRGAAACAEPGVYEAAAVPTPFVLGLFRPRIYLPLGLSGAERAYVLAHERAHIRRLDHATRLLAHLALCLHWWNPLVYLALRLSARDMELSCDERVLSRADGDERAGYANALLDLSAAPARLPGTPLAFGESDAKARIKNVLRYRRPALWLCAAAALVCLLAAACSLVTRAPEAETPAPGDYAVTDILYESVVYSFGYARAAEAPQYRIGADGTLWERGGLAGSGWTALGTLAETAFDAEGFPALFPAPYEPESFSPAAVAKEVRRAFALTPAADGVQDALLLETDGGLLLLLADNPLKTARWLFALSGTGAPFDTAAAEREIAGALELTEPVWCFAWYADPAAPDWLLTAWIAGEDMGYGVLRREGTSGGYALLGSSRYAGAAVSGEPVLCGPRLGDEGHEVVLDAILSNDPLLASVARTADGVREERSIAGAPSLTVFPAARGQIELDYSYREPAGTIDAPADQAGGQS